MRWTPEQYDAQIKELTKDPLKIQNHWCSGIGLFKWTEKSHPMSGCLTTIRNYHPLHTGTKAVIKGEIDEVLTEEIRSDERIPKKMEDIKPEHLPVFKEWQLRIDELQNS